MSVRAEERQGWPGTHCQYVSILSSRNCSTPLPGFAVESDQTAMAPISRSSDDLLPMWCPFRTFILQYPVHVTQRFSKKGRGMCH